MASASENIIQLDNSKCRICLFSNQNLCPLFKRGLSMKVMKLAEIKMYEGDGLPSSICLDCEFEVKRCIKFIARIQMADAKLKEMLAKKKELSAAYEKEKESVERLAEREEQEGEASTYQGDTENNDQPEDTNELNPLDNIQHNDQPENTNEPNPLIEIEEFNVKQEITSLDNFISEKEEVHSESDHDHFGEDIENNEQQQDENILNPINHVDIVEDRNRGDGMDVSNDPLGQEEPLIETQKNENDPSVDPLTCMKQEVVPMDIDKDTTPTASGSSSSDNGALVSTASIEPHLHPNTIVLQTQMPQQNKFYIAPVHQDTTYGLATTDLAQQTFLVLSTNSTPLFSVPQSESLNQIYTNSTSSSNIKQMKVTISKSTKKHLQDKEKCENKLYCLVCNIEFSSVELLQEHKTGDNYICRSCTSVFSSHAELETHFFTHKILKCIVCRRAFYCKHDLLEHRKKMHTFHKFQCDICNKSFTNLYRLERHKKKDHSTGENNYKCDVCGNSYKLPYQLKGHLIHTHSPSEHIECTFCPKIFLGPFALKKHVRQRHLYSEKNAPVSCSICGKIMASSFILARHLETHNTVDNVCEICGQTVKTKRAIVDHMALHHPKTGTYICEICNEKFGDQKAFRQHKRKHRMMSPIPAYCEICGKKYKDSNILKKHKQIHSNDRPFKCEICDATFKQQVALLTHRRVHSNVDKYKCDKCGVTFRWKQTFDKHASKCEVDSNLEDSEDD